MKKLILMGTGLLSVFMTYGQMMENWNFATNTGNCSNCIPGCLNIGPNLYAPQLSEGPGFPNWHTTHGSPNFPFSGTDPYPNDIELAASRSSGGAALGEGIAGGYNFVAGQTYGIGVGLRWQSSASVLHVALVRGSMPYRNTCDPVDMSCSQEGYQGNLPSVNSTDITYLTLPSYNVGDNHLYFTPTQNYNWIWVYASDPTQCATGARISYVYVFPECREDLYLDAATITPATYSAYKRIRAGSGSSSTMSTINAATYMLASESVTFVNKLDIRPTSGAVIAEVSRYSCGYPPVAWPKPAPPSETSATGMTLLPGRTLTLAGEKLDNVAVSPNPTSDIINLTLPNDGHNKTITLTGMNGNVLQTFTTAAVSPVISLKSYPGGIYFIRVSSGRETIVKKVIKR